MQRHGRGHARARHVAPIAYTVPMRERRRPRVVPRLVFSFTFAGVVPICFAAGACGGSSGAGTTGGQTDAAVSPKDACVSESGSCSDGAVVCDGTTCQACGGPGQPCCNGDKCTSGCCNMAATPSVCVATGSVCPEPEGAVGTDVCSSAGFCAPCGGENGPCCPTGAACQAGCCDSTKSCVNPGG